MNDNINENKFKTFDLTLATTLSLQCPIIALIKIGPRRIQFVFDSIPELNELVEKFWCSELTVEPQAFANQMKNLKTRIYSCN